MRQPAISAALLVALALAVQPSWSQESTRITGTIFTNPGARSIGLGGAFAAIADDASAAFSNPAGLVQILRPEISVELRATASRTHASYDLANGLSGLGFFSFVYPSRSWAVALYSHQLASVGFTNTGDLPLTRESTVRTFASAAAVEIGEHVSVGAGLGYFDGNLSSASNVSGISDSDWGLNAGVLWNPSRAWRIAGFYRQGPEFETFADAGNLMPRSVSTLPAVVAAPTVRFTFPDQYGVGFSIRPKAGALLVGFEWDRVGREVDPLPTGEVVTQGGSQYHLGIEYAVLRWKPVAAFRAGVWRETGRRLDVFDHFGVEVTSATEERLHMAFGLGLAFTDFQIDAGVDLSNRALVVSASLVYSF